MFVYSTTTTEDFACGIVYLSNYVQSSIAVIFSFFNFLLIFALESIEDLRPERISCQEGKTPCDERATAHDPAERNREIGTMFYVLCCVVMLFTVYNSIQAFCEGWSWIQFAADRRRVSVAASFRRRRIATRRSRSQKIALPRKNIQRAVEKLHNTTLCLR